MWLADGAAVLRHRDRGRNNSADATSVSQGGLAAVKTSAEKIKASAESTEAAESGVGARHVGTEPTAAAMMSAVRAAPAGLQANDQPIDCHQVHVASKAMRCAVAQQRLAVREFHEAARLRPRDIDTKKRLRAAREVLKRLQVELEPSKPQPFRRFLAHYNLSIRYWDLGKGQQAIAEAEHACDELRAAALPLGCAEHNLEVMAEVHAHFRMEEKRLQELVSRTPQHVGPSYELGVLYFDKRMLLRAESQLKTARERARAASALQLVGLDRRRQQLQDAVGPTGAPVWLSLEGRKNRRMIDLLEDIEDDLSFIAGLRQHWCAEEETGKAEELQETGVRDGTRPHLLPCLRRRYAPDCKACDEWWSNLCKCTEINLHAKEIRHEVGHPTRKFGNKVD